MLWLWFILGILGTGSLLLLFSLKGLIFVCQPNQVLIFSGTSRRVGDRRVGYRIIKGGMGWRKPFIERVDQLDLTNMIIELVAHGAYSKGGVPLNVQGVANVKIAGHEPVLNNAIERFLGKNRAEVMGIARATLEGSLRGVLATLTPEQINSDRGLLDEKIVQEVEADMTSLGLVVDTLKIQNITDDVRYLDSIGRTRNAELLSSARVAEAIARADSVVRSAENFEQEAKAKIKAETTVSKADADKRLIDAETRMSALVAEERAVVAAMVAQSKAEVDVQKARVEQIRQMLEANVVAPARAECEAMEQKAAADVAPIIEEGKARADAMMKLATSWQSAGDEARQIFLLQKLEPIIHQLTQTIADTRIDKVTVIDSKSTAGQQVNPAKLIALAEQVKHLFGVDLVEKFQELASTERGAQPGQRALLDDDSTGARPSPPPVR